MLAQLRRICVRLSSDSCENLALGVRTSIRDRSSEKTTLGGQNRQLPPVTSSDGTRFFTSAFSLPFSSTSSAVNGFKGDCRSHSCTNVTTSFRCVRRAQQGLHNWAFSSLISSTTCLV